MNSKLHAMSSTNNSKNIEKIKPFGEIKKRKVITRMKKLHFYKKK